MKNLTPERSVEEIVEELFGQDLIRSKKFENKIKKVLQTERQKREEVVEQILSLAPGFENTKTGEVTYDVGVMEWQARIKALTQPNNK